MEVLPNFTVVAARSIDDVIKARADHPDSRLLGGGTDLVVNIRRGIVAPPVLIDVAGIGEMSAIEAGPDRIEVGAAVKLEALANHGEVGRHFSVVAQAAGSIAGPTQRNMGTVGGNLCLDTRCIFYNQSEWWRGTVNHCLKTTGEICHVAPKSRGVCFATFSGDLAPAFLALDAEVDLAGPLGRRTMPLARLYIGYARESGLSEDAGDGKRFLSLRPGEFIVAVRARKRAGAHSGYDKIRIRRSIEYPVAGVGASLRRDGGTVCDLRVAFTGTNPRPVLLQGTEGLAGPFDEGVLKAVDELARDQLMSMKTTFTPGHYRRRIACVLARRLLLRLFAEAGAPRLA